jgi:hypothetical protein
MEQRSASLKAVFSPTPKVSSALTAPYADGTSEFDGTDP